MADELSDADVMKPPSGEMSDADVMKPAEQGGREGGILQTVPEAIGMMQTPQGRAQLWQGIKAEPGNFVKGILDWFETPGKAMSEGISSEEEIGFGLNTALGTIGGKSIPREIPQAVAPVAKAFTDTILAPSAVRLDAYARTGDPNGVRLEPPAPEVKPAPIRPVEGSPFEGVPRSVAARTGVPEVDAVLDSPVTKSVIDNTVIDRSHDVPYMAGASKELNDPTVFIDKHVPAEQKVGGVTFDPAEPWAVHEHVEQHTMDLLIKGGMDDQIAYKVAHFNFAEPAEQAWYRAHGIDQEAAEAQQAKWLPKIQGETTGGDVPQSLYKKPYPHDAVPNVDHESLIEPKPTPEESARGAQIVRDWAAKQTTSAAPMLQEARSLGVIGMDAPEHIDLAALAERDKEMPAEEAIRAVPPQSLGAARTPKEMLGDMPGRGGQEAYEQRVREWVGKIDAPDDVRDAIGRIAEEENFFPAAREGELEPAHVAKVAEAAGIDPTDIDRAGLATRFDNDAKVRAVIQALRHTTRDFLEASERAQREPSEENAAALTEAQERQRYVQEYTLGFRGEAGRTLNTWKELLRETERARATTKLKADEETGAAPKGVSDLIDAANETQSNLAKPETEKIGLQKLIDAAENLVNAPQRAPGEKQPPIAPELKGLVDEANRTLAQLFDQIDGKQRKGDAELEAFRAELVKLEKGEGNLGAATDAARRFVEATKKEPKEGAQEEAGRPKERGKLASAARRFVQAADREPQVAKAPASAEMQALMETARQAVGRLKGSHVQAEFETFRQALEQKDYDAAVVAAKRLTESEPKPAVGAPKPPVEYDQAMNAARRVAKAAEEQIKGAKAKLPPDLEALLNDAKQAAGELTAQRHGALSKLVKAAEQQAINMVKQKAVREPKDALPPELQALVDKADLVTKRFGGIAKGEQAAMLLARMGKTAAEQAELARSVQGLTDNQVARVLARLRTEKRPGWFFWSVQQGLISGLITHTKYAIVNAGQTVLDRVVAPELAAIGSRLRGGDASLVAPLHALPAMIRAVPDAFAGVKQAFKTGMRVPLESELRLAERGERNPEAAGAQVPYGTPQGPNWGIWKKVFNEQQLAKAERVIGVPGRSANSIHTFFKILNENGAASLRAYETAAKEKPGAAFWDRYQHHLDNPTDAALRANVEDAYSGTFMEKLGDQSEKFAKLVRNSPAKWLIFFTHIPLNMIRRSVEYSPLALANLLGETRMGSAIKGELGPEAQNLAFAKMAIGTFVGGYFIDQALRGKATGDYPTDPKERRRWQDLGIQPNSIQADGQWVSLERLGPPALVARIAANYAAVIQHYDGHDDDALMKASLSLVLGTANALASDVGFETIKNIVDVLENPREAARFAAWQLSSYAMPVSLVTQFASAMDPDMRRADTLLSGLKYHIPVLRETLLPKRDPLYGEPVPNPGYHGILRSSPINADPVKQELDRIGYYPAPPQRTIGGVRLNDAQYDRYEATAGPFVKQSLSAAIRSPVYQRLPVAQQQAMVKGIISYNRAKARAALQMDWPHLIQQGIDQRRGAILGR